MNKRQHLGAQGEQIAARHLQQHGYSLVERNFRCPLGEMDIIARDGETLVFVEVKTRTSRAFGPPAAAVTRQKQRQLIKVAQYFLQARKLDGQTARFDVVSVYCPKNYPLEVEILANAFDIC